MILFLCIANSIEIVAVIIVQFILFKALSNLRNELGKEGVWNRLRNK